MDCSLRRALNLAFAWWVPKLDIDSWKENFEAIFNETHEERAARQEAAQRWNDPDEHGRGEFVLQREDSPVSSSMNFAPARS